MALIGSGLLLFIALAPVLKTAFGWGAPLMVLLVLGSGLYLIWPRSPEVRLVDVLSLLGVAWSVLGLLDLSRFGGGVVGAGIAWWTRTAST